MTRRAHPSLATRGRLDGRAAVARSALLLGLLLPLRCGATALLADPLPGRLFHSAQERAALDRSEHLTRLPGPRPRATVRPVPPERSDRLSGFVLRSDGFDSYWVDPAPPRPGALRR